MTDSADPDGPPTTDYDKLVRDDVPDAVRADGETPVVRRVDGEAYERSLAAKLVEEAAEFREGRDPAELADVLEVVEALLDATDREAVERLRAGKAAERGRFADGVVLERVVHAPEGGADAADEGGSDAGAATADDADG